MRNPASRPLLTDGIVIREGREELDAALLHLLLELVHQACAEALHLLLGGDGEEDDFGELLTLEDAEADPTDHLLVVLQDYHRFMISIEDEFHDVFLWHFRELFREDVLQINQLFHILVSPKAIKHRYTPYISLPIILYAVEGIHSQQLLFLNTGVPFREPDPDCLSS